MGFPTVKSCPYKKGIRKKPAKRGLWTESQWKEILRVHKESLSEVGPKLHKNLIGLPFIPFAVLELIKRYNGEIDTV
jgi:hypothetical protein